MKNIELETGDFCIIQNNSRHSFFCNTPTKVHVERVFKKTIEFRKTASTEKFILRKSDFGFWGNWDLIEIL